MEAVQVIVFLGLVVIAIATLRAFGFFCLLLGHRSVVVKGPITGGDVMVCERCDRRRVL